MYSSIRTLALDPVATGAIELTLDQVVAAERFEQTDRVKLFEVVSPSMSKFYGRDVKIRAAVVLPEDWKNDPSARYPVLYVITGFGGDHHYAHALAKNRSAASHGDQVLTVVPDPTCFRGHSVFADSENNGPWGRALTEELIPQLELTFHGAQSAKHRYLTGVSSGGWGSLWLQVRYPDLFNGCWSHCPDPVDFRDFQRINLYQPGANMYTDDHAQRRPLARRGDAVMLWYDDFVRREDVLGPGGQIHSFEAVFSKKRPDGTPEPLFNRDTGKVDTDVARTWERYDLRLILERNWETLKPKLAGKLHIFAGGKDTFYLDGAAVLLKESLAKLSSDAEVVIVPEMAHGLYRDAVEPMYKTILDNFRKEFASNSPAAAGG